MLYSLLGFWFHPVYFFVCIDVVIHGHGFQVGYGNMSGGSNNSAATRPKGEDNWFRHKGVNDYGYDPGVARSPPTHFQNIFVGRNFVRHDGIEQWASYFGMPELETTKVAMMCHIERLYTSTHQQPIDINRM